MLRGNHIALEVRDLGNLCSVEGADVCSTDVRLTASIRSQSKSVHARLTGVGAKVYRYCFRALLQTQRLHSEWSKRQVVGDRAGRQEAQMPYIRSIWHAEARSVAVQLPSTWENFLLPWHPPSEPNRRRLAPLHPSTG